MMMIMIYGVLRTKYTCITDSVKHSIPEWVIPLKLLLCYVHQTNFDL